MFEDFIREHPPVDEIKPSKKRVNTKRAALRSLIKKEEETVKIQKFRLKPLTAIAAAVIAAAALTATAGAATNWTFGSFFGESAENLKPYLVSDSSYEIVNETFEDYDFEVTGVAADKNIIYIGLDVIALKEMNAKQFVSSDLLCDGELLGNFGLGGRYISEGKKRSSMLLTVDHYETEISEDCDVTLCLDSMYAKDKRHPLGYAFGNKETATAGRLEINMRLKNSETKNIALNREMTVPVLIGEVGKPTVNGEQQWLIKDICVSGLSLTLTAERAYNDDISLDLDDKKLKLRLSDGTTVAMWGGCGGEVIFDENDRGIWMKVNGAYSVTTPVNLDDVEAVLIGDNVIPVK